MARNCHWHVGVCGSGLEGDEPLASGVGGRLDPVGGAGLSKDVADVVGDGAEAFLSLGCSLICLRRLVSFFSAL